MSVTEVSNLEINGTTYRISDDTARQSIEDLCLDVSDGSILLKRGNTVLSSVEIPNVFDAVPCDSVEATGDFTGVLAGETRQIQVELEPVNCTQIVRYSSSNTDIATVSGTGLVSLVSNGSATITVSCGEYSSDISLVSSRRVNLAGNLHVCNWYNNIGTVSSYPDAVGFVVENVDIVGNFPCDLDKMRIKPGESVSLSFDNNNVEAKFSFIKILKAVSGKQIEFIDNTSESMPRYYINNVVEVDAATDIHNKTQNSNNQWGFWGQNTYEYTNNLEVDTFIMFGVKDNQSLWKSSDNASVEGPAWVAEHVKLIIT